MLHYSSLEFFGSNTAISLVDIKYLYGKETCKVTKKFVKFTTKTYISCP